MACRNNLTDAQKAIYKEFGDVLLQDTVAAPYAGLTPDTLRQWRCRGEGPPFVKIGRAVRYRLSELDAWLAANTYSNTSQY